MSEGKNITIPESVYLELLNKKEESKEPEKIEEEEPEEEEEEPKEQEQGEKKPLPKVRAAKFKTSSGKEKKVTPRIEVLECPRCHNTKDNELLKRLEPDEIFIYKGHEVRSIFRCGACRKKFVAVD